MENELKMQIEMNSKNLLKLLAVIEEAKISVWLDGGWGVDALLGWQTRKHKDVDLILELKDVPKLQEIFEVTGFVFKEGIIPHSFVYHNNHQLEVDVHSIFFDNEGNGHYKMRNEEYWIYPSEGFSGIGMIEDKKVNCLSPLAQILCHAHGYEPVEKDFLDMRNLQNKFNLDIPEKLKSK